MDNFFDKSFDELAEIISGFDQKPFRLDQILKWAYVKCEDDFNQMTNIPESLRLKLSGILALETFETVSTVRTGDGTVKFLFRLEDGELIESVIIPEEGHNTLCVSTQAGCSMGCSFCETSTIGLKRNLTQGEILAQIANAIRYLGDRLKLRNLVFMGMGEPLKNLDSLLPALRIILDKRAFDFSPRRVTVSTCGWVPGIARLAEEDLRIQLAVSLNASEDTTRTKLMPVNRKYPLDNLIGALKKYPLTRNQRISFEYILIKDLNDAVEDAIRLAGLLKEIPAKVNLIPCNRTSSGYESSSDRSVRAFQEVLLENGILGTLRKSRGSDIGAACGQLAAGKRDDNV